MKESRLDELLARLKKLDLIHISGIMMYRFGSGLRYIRPGLPYAWLQYVIQDAAKKRGWDSGVYCYSGGNAEGAVFISEDMSVEECGGDTPAEALLAAYIGHSKRRRRDEDRR
jgi:hypothetical protein